MNKLFVNYSGTIESFKRDNLETEYLNHIVFIQGSKAIYTHNTYYMEVSENDLGTLFVYSDPNLDFEATDNNVDSYGYVGTLQNINVNGDLILIDSIAVYVREGKSSPNLNTPVWCRLLKLVDGNWEIIYQSIESKTIQDIAPETLFSFKMKAVNGSNKLIKSSDRIAIVYVDREDAPVLSSTQLGFKSLSIPGGLSNAITNSSSGNSALAPAFVVGYLSMADDNYVNIESSQTITGRKQFNDGINISGKSFITSAIDGGELKVLHNNSSKGFIIRTVNGSDDVLPLEILSTDGLDSYKYTFPPKSGEVAIKEDVNSVVSPLQEDITNIKNKDAEQDAKINNVKGTLEQTFAEIASVLDEKQPLLTGDEFKTINGQSIMGDGNIEVKEGMTEAEKSEINAKIDNIVIPTKVSELENDEGYITEIPEGYATKEDVNEAVSGKQDALTLTVKDNGNIVIGNINGQSKEFMPATPSGDPMHYAYVSAGAEYNATDAIIQKTAPWGTNEKWKKNEDGTYTHWEEPAIVEHLQGHWYLNGIGDITKEQMRGIYNAGAINSNSNIGRFQSANIRTNLKPTIDMSGEEGYGNYAFAACFESSSIEVAYLSRNNNMIKLSSSFYACFSNASKLRYIYPTINVSNVGQSHLSAFYDCKSLIDVKLLGIKYNLNWRDSGSISKESVLYSIQNATPTTAITITLHPDAYARLAEDADIVAALEAQPLVTLVSA